MRNCNTSDCDRITTHDEQELEVLSLLRANAVRGSLRVCLTTGELAAGTGLSVKAVRRAMAALSEKDAFRRPTPNTLVLNPWKSRGADKRAEALYRRLSQR